MNKLYKTVNKIIIINRMMTKYRTVAGPAGLAERSDDDEPQRLTGPTGPIEPPVEQPVIEMTETLMDKKKIHRMVQTEVEQLTAMGMPSELMMLFIKSKYGEEYVGHLEMDIVDESEYIREEMNKRQFVPLHETLEATIDKIKCGLYINTDAEKADTETETETEANTAHDSDSECGVAEEATDEAPCAEVGAIQDANINSGVEYYVANDISATDI